MGPTRSICDPGVYYAWKSKILLIVSIYVDDFLISSHNEGWIKLIKHQLSTYFEVKDLGKAKYCLGLEINQKRDVITVNQSSYLREVIHKFNMQDANSAVTPLPLGTKLSETVSKEPDTSRIPYRELVGALMYAAVATRPDIAFVVSYLAQFNHRYAQQHWGMAKRVLRYLISTQNVGLRY